MSYSGGARQASTHANTWPDATTQASESEQRCRRRLPSIPDRA